MTAIGVRGSGEPYNTDEFGMGPFNRLAFQQIKNRVPDAQPFGLPYQAVAVDSNTANVITGEYWTSVSLGTVMLRNYVEQLIAECPYRRIALLGYSQGAHVIGDLLAIWGVDANVMAHIAAVLFFGDSRFNPVAPFNQGDFNTSLQGVFYARTVSSVWWGKIRSYCADQDFICNWSVPNLAACHDPNAIPRCGHFSYATSGQAEAGGIWLGNLAKALPPLGGPPPPAGTVPPAPQPAPLLVIRTGSDILGKEGLTGNWVVLNPSSVTDVRVSGQRITWTSANGHLFAKDGLFTGWVDEYTGASQYAASSSLLVIRTGGALLGKVGLTDNWTTLIPSGAADVQVTGNRITYTDTSGNIYAKDGLFGTWYQLYSAVSQYAVSPSLFVIRTGTALHGKTCLTCNWTWSLSATPATDVRVAGNRVTYIDIYGHLYAKDGLTGAWVDEYTGVSQYAASSSLLITRTGTALNGKTCLTCPWTWSFNPTPAVDVKVSGDRIMYTDINGRLWVKDGLTGTWVDEYPNVSQYATS